MAGMTYVSKPQQIEALQWTGDNYPKMADFAGDKVAIDINLDPKRFELRAGVDGSQGWVPVPVGHWIVRTLGDDTDYWPVEDTYFRQKYQEVNIDFPGYWTPEAHACKGFGGNRCDFPGCPSND